MVFSSQRAVPPGRELRSATSGSRPRCFGLCPFTRLVPLTTRPVTARGLGGGAWRGAGSAQVRPAPPPSFLKGPACPANTRPESRLKYLVMEGERTLGGQHVQGARRIVRLQPMQFLLISVTPVQRTMKKKLHECDGDVKPLVSPDPSAPPGENRATCDSPGGRPCLLPGPCFSPVVPLTGNTFLMI